MKRTRAAKEPTPLALSNHHHQTSLKDHFRVIKPRHADKENDSGAVVSPPGKSAKSPMLPMSGRHTAMQHLPISLMASAPASATTPVLSSAPVLSECVSLSTAPFEFPAPSEDTGAPADISSKPPSHKMATAGLFQRSMPLPAAPAQPHTLSTADPDEISCRHRPLPAQAARLANRASSAATFSSGGMGSVGQPDDSTASLASWLPGKGASSMQAAACTAEESDCEDDAVSQRWTVALPAVAAPTPTFTDMTSAQADTCTAPCPAGSPVGAPADDGAPAGLVSGSEESDAGADFMPLLLQLASGSATAVPVVQQDAGRVMYHTRMEELLFAMDYVAPATAENDGAEE